MTGFGEAETDLEAGRLRAEVRTVNNRYLNIRFRMPSTLDRHQRALESTIKNHFSRGQINVSIVYDSGFGREGAGTRPVIDLERARAYLDGLHSLQEETGVGGSIDIGVLARLRGVFEEEDPQGKLGEIGENLLMDLVEEATRRALAVREQEGASLAADLLERIDAMETEISRIERKAPERLVAERDRLREAVRSLLDGETPVDEDRVAREIAHLAERWDVHEELVRFRSHLEMLRSTLEDPEPAGVGKRLGFIAQELLREANTIGSKANDAEIGGAVIALKEEIERLREQIENIE